MTPTQYTIDSGDIMARKRAKLNDLLSIADTVIESKSSGNNYFEPAYQVIYNGQSRGMMLGSGLYSKVFKHPEKENRVIKVFKEMERTGLSAYGRYLLKVLKNPEYKNKRCLPKIFKITCIAFKDEETYYFCVEMEKLHSMTESECAEHLPKKYPTRGDLKKHPILQNFWKEHKNYVGWDLHSGNIMLRPSSNGRKRNQWVLTDPFCDA
jgi:hypothetical protein